MPILSHIASRLLPTRVTNALRTVRRLRAGWQLVEGPLAYAADGLYTSHNADFMNDPRFAAAYAAGKATGSWHGWELPWRAYIVCTTAEMCARIPGDFVECGVNKGGYAAMIAKYLNFRTLDRQMYLLDTFEGFDLSQMTERERETIATNYQYDACYEEVRRTFARYDNIHLIRGSVPGTLDEVPSDSIAYLSIDMNCVAPEIAAAEYFWDRMSPGGVIVLDDYGQSRHIAQKEAFDQFAAERGVSIMCLPTSQGLIFKPMEVPAEVVRGGADRVRRVRREEAVLV